MLDSGDWSREALGCNMFAPVPLSLSLLPLTHGFTWEAWGCKRRSGDTRRKPHHLQRLLKQAL